MPILYPHDVVINLSLLILIPFGGKLLLRACWSCLYNKYIRSEFSPEQKIFVRDILFRNDALLKLFTILLFAAYLVYGKDVINGNTLFFTVIIYSFLAGALIATPVIRETLKSNNTELFRLLIFITASVGYIFSNYFSSELIGSSTKLPPLNTVNTLYVINFFFTILFTLGMVGLFAAIRSLISNISDSLNNISLLIHCMVIFVTLYMFSHDDKLLIIIASKLDHQSLGNSMLTKCGVEKNKSFDTEKSRVLFLGDGLVSIITVNENDIESGIFNYKINENACGLVKAEANKVEVK